MDNKFSKPLKIMCLSLLRVWTSVQAMLQPIVYKIKINKKGKNIYLKKNLLYNVAPFQLAFLYDTSKRS